MRDRADPHARERALVIACEHPPLGVSPEQAVILPRVPARYRLVYVPVSRTPGRAVFCSRSRPNIVPEQLGRPALQQLRARTGVIRKKLGLNLVSEPRSSLRARAVRGWGRDRR
jgi:hypothetical protein